MSEQDFKNLSYEELTSELNLLLRKMDNNQIPLEELLSSYERGTKLLGECRKRLGDFEKKIAILTKDDGANGEWSDFNPDTDRVRKDNDLF
jgi:exodeoxyribonuclease VII small subunit